MKINSIFINGFGKLENKNIQFKSGINVIMGDNESGKSTLLDFLLAMFFGLSKKKDGKNLSNFEKYTPWKTNNFSGTLDYELDNKKQYRVARTFSRRSLKVFNSNSEDISNNFRINENKENDFFYEQTNIDEELFLKTFCAAQEELKLGKVELLIQKITNLIQTGSDDIEYNKIVESLNIKMRDEIGTNKTQSKPLQNVNQNIEKLIEQKKELEKYQNKKIENIEIKNNLIKEINLNKNKLELFLEIKKIKEKEKIELEKINIKKEIEEKNEEEKRKIELEKINIEKEIREIQELEKEKNNSEKNTKKVNKEQKVLNSLMTLIAVLPINIIFNVILNIIQNKIYFKIFSVLIILINLILIVFLRRKNNNKNKFIINSDNKLIIIEKNKILNNLNNELIKIEENKKNKLEELEKIKNKTIINLNLEKEKIINLFKNKINLEEIKNNLENNYEKINSEYEKIQSYVNSIELKLYTIKLEEESILSKVDDLSQVEEELEYEKAQYKALVSLGNSIELVKTGLRDAYKKMKEEVSPVFLQYLSKNTERITKNTYKNVKINEKSEIIVETEDGNYRNFDNLSCGTVYQLFISLRLALLRGITNESIPIVLDESLVYFDQKRMLSLLNFLNTEYSNNQIILFTCSNREIECLELENIDYNLINMC